jgi:hypothetical protein
MDTSELGEIIAKLLGELGIGRTLLGMLILLITLISLNFSTKLIEYIFLKKIKGKEKDKETKIQETINKFFVNTDKYIEKLDESNQINSVLLEKLQVSASLEKFEILMDAFLGYNRDFLTSLNFKLCGYIELEKFENFQHIKNEIKNLFMEKVINRINNFIIYDDKLTKNIKKESMKLIDTFLNKFIKKSKENTDLNTKEYLESEEGTYSLISSLNEIIKNEYIKIIYNDSSLNFLREK